MLDPRIYRTSLIVTVLALVVLGFSLRSQPGPLRSTLAPDAFNDQAVWSNLTGAWGRSFPDRRPGSVLDDALASDVAGSFRSDHLTVSTDTFPARTVQGTRTLRDVIGVWPGIDSGSILVLADRDLPGAAGLSGTATLEELAHDLQGETVNRSIVLASTSGAAGAAGAIHLAATLPGPVDAVVALGDVAATHVRQPIVLPWSTRHVLAPAQLRNTVAAAISGQSQINTSGGSFGAQLAHLAFPFTLGQQAPFNAAGVPAVEVSLSGERGPAPGEPISQASVRGMGRALLETMSALDVTRPVAPPSSYLLLSGQVMPGSGVALFVLALVLPVLLTTLDGVARARRRGHIIWRSASVVLAAGVPFMAAVAVALAARVLGILSVAPPGPVAPGLVPITGAGIAVMSVAAVVAVAAGAAIALLARRTLPHAVRARSRRRAPERTAHGAAAALLLVMCLLTLVIWVVNPFAALLLVPALHLWLWGVTPDLRLPAPARIALVLAGVAPVALVVLFYANSLGYSPAGLVWEATLLLAGHGVSLLSTVLWTMALGCLATAVTLAVLSARRPEPVAAPTAVPGPATYAGPGSLGGTHSALRR